MKKAILFDLGNTLAAYHTSAEWPAILERCIGEVQDELRRRGLLRLSPEEVWAGVRKESREVTDYRVLPMEERLMRVFQLDLPPDSPLIMALCRRFIRPIVTTARLYDDTLPVLQQLTARGVRMGLISNAPWGTPSVLWHEEVGRLGLIPYLEAVVICTDVGWRKPAPQIFQYALAQLGVTPDECLLVGDDTRWDIVGARAVGMEALLIERHDPILHPEERPIRNLYELLERL